VLCPGWHREHTATAHEGTGEGRPPLIFMKDVCLALILINTIRLTIKRKQGLQGNKLILTPSSVLVVCFMALGIKLTKASCMLASEPHPSPSVCVCECMFAFEIGNHTHFFSQASL
jgi:hypothetical protein